MEHIDIKVLLNKLLRKWHWFALSLLFTLTLAFLYLATTKNEYLVESTIQLKDKSLSEKGKVPDKFLTGLELVSSNSELEDEEGILTSFATIRQSLESLGFDVNYYQYPGKFGSAGKYFSQEVYPAPFKVNLDQLKWQLTNTPVYISFLNKNQYRVRVAAEDQFLNLYQPQTQTIKKKELTFNLDTVLSVTQPLHTSYLNIALDSIDDWAWESGKEYYITINSLRDLTEWYHSKLNSTTISEKSNIVKLSLTGTAPDKDIAFLNALSKVYIINDMKKKNRLGEKTIEFIDIQLQGVTDSLRRTEKQLQSFRANSQIVDVDKTSQSLSEQLFSLEEKQAQLTVQNKYYQHMADYLARNDNVADIVAPSSVGIQDELLNSLLIQLSKLNEEKISKDYSTSENNPMLQLLVSKIQSTKKQLLDNINNLIGSNKIALQESSRRVAEIKKTINSLPQNERKLTDINRRFTFNDNIYNYLLQKKAETGIAIASNVPDKSIIDEPRQVGNGPVKPNKMLILLMALVFGLVAPAGLIFVNELFQTKLESDDQITKWTDIPLIERVAQLKDKEKNNPYTGESYLAHAFRYIRHHLDFIRLTPEDKTLTLGITSAKSGEGKTFCALNLAISYAQAGHKTLLIDADLHHPSLASLLEISSSQAGLGDYIVHGQKPDLMETNYKGLNFLSAGTPQENPSDLVSHNRFSALMATLKEEYEIIILDTPPVGIVADYMMLSKHTDFTLVVIRQEVTKKEDVLRLNKLIKGHHLKAGIIYNGARFSDFNNGYYNKVPKNKYI